MPDVQVYRENRETVATIAPVPAADRTLWTVTDEAAHGQAYCDVAIAIERIWWLLGEVDVQPDSSTAKWQSIAIMGLDRDSFRAASNRCLWVRMPDTGRFDAVEISLSQYPERIYRATQGMVCIPLSEFCDAEQVRNAGSETRLNLWLGGSRPVALAVAPAANAEPSTPRHVADGWARFRSALAHARLNLHGGANEPAIQEPTINGQPWREYFANSPEPDRAFLCALLRRVQNREDLKQYVVEIDVKGSTPETRRQIRAAAHALGRAVLPYMPELGAFGYGGVRVSRNNPRSGVD